ncbi:unnamed protein product [Chironomus riparius]|uniref:CRAL-TRIO domain-containing protein n=1 Tax=Chironomus riparius TaxID=315576 RepID=A0A9N9WU45_9DIPT|nr:unnamed protein product [Chironomus riparius]
MPKIRPLSEALQKVAIEELNEVPERIEEDIESIRQWIKKMPHLKSRDDDQFIITFLRGCKFSLEKAKKKIESFYKARAETPEFFANRDVCDKTMSEIMNFGFIIPMPVDENKPEPKVVLTQLGNYDPNKYTFVDIMKVTYFFGDLSMFESDVTIVIGTINVVDLRGCGLNLLTQVTPTLIKKLSGLLEPFPVRVKAIHLVYPPKALDMAFSILNSVCHEKLRNRIYVHENFDKMYEQLPHLKNHLPSDLGGTNSSLEKIRTDLKKLALDRREWFLEDEKQFRYIPPKDSENSNGLFGVGGSFRSLNID